MPFGYKPVFVQEAQGHSRGIWVLSCIQNIQFVLVDQFTQSVTFRLQRRNVSWFCFAK